MSVPDDRRPLRERVSQWRPAPGWFTPPEGRRGFWERLDLARVSVVKAGRQAGAAAHKVAAQGLQKAKLTGARLARHIVSVQKAAGATPRMMAESARSVMNRPMTRAGDRAWQSAYVAEAQRLGVPGLAPKPAAVITAPAPAGPDRPAWPNAGPSGPVPSDREAT